MAEPRNPGIPRGLAFGVGVAAGGAALNDLQNLYRNATAGAAATNQNITFPDDLISTNEERNAYCNLRFSRYVRRSIREQPRLTIESGIKLPLPTQGLRELQSVEYGTTELGPMIGAAADAISGFPAGDYSSLASSLASNLFVGGAAEAYSRAAFSPTGRFAALSGFENQARAAVSSLSGTAINPFQTVLFKAPNFKKHAFTWKLIPRNSKESEKIREIIERLKYHSSPGISQAGGVFFSYPEILEIQLFPNDVYLYKFKPCVVESVTVNYAPNGPSVYRETGAPTAVEISLGIQEIEYWTKNDYSAGRVFSNRSRIPLDGGGGNLAEAFSGGADGNAFGLGNGTGAGVITGTGGTV